MDPLSIISTVIKYVLPNVLPNILGKIGDEVGDSASEAVSQSARAIRNIVRKKMESTHTDGVLTQAQGKPTKANVSVLETLLIGQMTSDPEFTERLQRLIAEVEARSPQLQSALENVRIQGSAEVGNVRQVSNGSSNQVIGNNLGVGGDFKIGDITQEN